MKFCGVHLKASEAIFAIVQRSGDGTVSFKSAPTKKLTIGNDKDADALRRFKQSSEAFVRENAIEVLVIRSRAHSGQMAGGAVSFKMEAALQLADGVRCEFISPQATAAYLRSHPFDKPTDLLAYQTEAFQAAMTFISKV